MSSLATQLGQSYSDHPLRLSFMKWQCRVRQVNMRDGDGRPDDAIMPAVYLDGAAEPLGHIITLLNKSPSYSVTPESEGALTIRRAQTCRLVFEAYSQRFDLNCKVWKLARHNALYQATMAHNRLFNPTIPPDTIVLGFEPDWGTSSSDTPAR